jgi:hypothetical protein
MKISFFMAMFLPREVDFIAGVLGNIQIFKTGKKGLFSFLFLVVSVGFLIAHFAIFLQSFSKKRIIH